MIKITDEMFSVFSAIYDNESAHSRGVFAGLEAVAPLIAAAYQEPSNGYIPEPSIQEPGRTNRETWYRALKLAALTSPGPVAPLQLQARADELIKILNSPPPSLS